MVRGTVSLLCETVRVVRGTVSLLFGTDHVVRGTVRFLRGTVRVVRIGIHVVLVDYSIARIGCNVDFIGNSIVRVGFTVDCIGYSGVCVGCSVEHTGSSGVRVGFIIVRVSDRVVRIGSSVFRIGIHIDFIALVVIYGTLKLLFMFSSKRIADMKADYFHIGFKINELLEQRRMTRRELGIKLGISTSNAIHLITREKVDVHLLQKVGNALKYDFFKHFPIDDGQGNNAEDVKKAQELSAEKDAKIAELEKQLEEMKREAVPANIEMKYLKQGYEDLRQANEMLLASIRPTLRLRTGPQRKKSLKSAEHLMIGDGKLRGNEE